jgi:hypothetical protein
MKLLPLDADLERHMLAGSRGQDNRLRPEIGGSGTTPQMAYAHIWCRIHLSHSLSRSHQPISPPICQQTAKGHGILST